MNNNSTLKVIFISIALISFCIFLLSFTYIFLEFDVVGLYYIFISLASMIIFWILAYYLSKDYQLKYFILGKNFKNQLNKSLIKLNTSNKEFLNEFKKIAKQNYHTNGNIFNNSDHNLYKYNENIKKCYDLYKVLLNAIKTKGGFVEFCNNVNTMDYESGYEIEYLMTGSLVPKELSYIIKECYYLTDFIISDNKLDEEFTKMNNEKIKTLNEVLSPMLFNFEDELKLAILKLEKVVNNSKN